ncbi:MAG: hypothetical protein AAF674_11745 [Pseudomonadota bacterium]
MDRRRFLLSAAVAGLSTPSLAEIACNQGPGHYQQTCDVGVIIGNIATPWQQCKLWCWAACVETAFGLRGYRVNQQMMAQKLFGDPYVCQPANGPMIEHVVNGNWTDLNGRAFQARLDIVMDLDRGISHPNPMGVIWDELRAGRPLLSGSLGHATLITAMNYTQAQGTTPQTNYITLRDPWPESPNKRLMTPQEFYGARLLATFRIS